MSKDLFSQEQLKSAFISGLDIGYYEGSHYGEPDVNIEFNKWFEMNYNPSNLKK